MRRAFVLLLWFAAAPAPAVTMEHLFDVSLLVADRTAQSRAAVLRDALGEVLVRLTGERGVAERPSARELLAEPARFVRQYRYDSAAPAAGLLFRVEFDAPALEAALRSRDLPLWGRERPATLVWLAVEQGGTRELLDAQSAGAVRTAVERAAARRGIPLLFPLLDLEEQLQVRFLDVWGGFMERVAAASERYAAHSILAGRVFRNEEGAWTAGRWWLRIAGAEAAWTGGEGELEAVLGRAMDVVADRLVARHAPPGGLERSRAPLVVEGVTSLADYARVLQYLESLSPVRSLQVTGLAQSRLELSLDLEGGAPALDRAIAIGSPLEPLAGDAPAHYRLRP